MIGVVGTGITGLALARELARRGVEHTVFEAADRPGGAIRSERIDGRVVEWGPQRGRLTPALAALVEELGLAPRLLLAPAGLPLYVWAGGRLRAVPFSLGALLAGDLLPWPARLRVLLEPLTAGPRSDEPVDRMLARKAGRAAYERLLGPLYGGLTASDPADMVVGLSIGPTLRDLGVGRSMLLSLARRRGAATPRAFSFPDGLGELVDALHRESAAAVRLGAPVRAIEPAVRGWSIALEGESVAVDAVVVTCAAPAAARILAPAAPEAAARIARLRSNPLALVPLLAEPGLRGLGYQVALGEPLATRGVTWNDALFDRGGLHTAFLGGARRPEVVDEPDDRIGARAAEEFERVTGRPARPLAVGRASMPAWDASWAALDGLALPPGIEVAAAWRSRPGIPGRLADARRLAERLAVRAAPIRE